MFKLFAYNVNDLMSFLAGPTMSRSSSCSSNVLAMKLVNPQAAPKKPAPDERAKDWEEFEEQPVPGLEKEKPPAEPLPAPKPAQATCIVDFLTHCQTSNHTWQQRVALDDINLVPAEALSSIQNFTDLSKYPEVLNGNIRVGCNCPSFVFWGNAYEVDSVDSGDGSLRRYKDHPHPETRAPARNVQLPGYLCKHLISVLSKFFG